MSALLNNGSGEAPQLKIYLNLDNLAGLPSTSVWPKVEGKAKWERLRADGFDGVQLTSLDDAAPGADLGHTGLNRINRPEECDAIFAQHQARGDEAITLHLGWGMESDAEMDALVAAVLAASAKYALPAFIETHRATITQDMWRTVELTKRLPAVRFNGDFSHLYCGQEMVYGDFDAKLDFLQPVFDRIGYMHGRIAAPGYMQAPIQTSDQKPQHAVGGDYLADFKAMWTRSMAGFQRNAGPGDVLIFSPELLRSEIYYARVFPDDDGILREESDRYAEAILYAQIARECWAKAQAT